jgi:hypothetical protein
MDALLGSLAETELALVREVDPDRLAGLDEDALIELHTRVRRARNKHVKLYRRQAAALVEDVGGRGKARPGTPGTGPRRRSSRTPWPRSAGSWHRRHRRAPGSWRPSGLAQDPPPRDPPAAKTKLKPQRTDRRPKSAELRKRQASTRASGARRQARKDSR